MNSNEKIIKKYIYANVRIPLEVYEDNQFTALNDYASVTFSECEGKHSLEKNDGLDLHSAFHTMILENETQPSEEPVEQRETFSQESDSGKSEQITISIEELKLYKKKRPKTSTFKKASNIHKNYTAKIYE